MDKIVVFLSTYNGELYLEDQLLSILSQKDVAVAIYARDDGSTDGTINILEKYKRQGLLSYSVGKNLGPAWSFMELIYSAPKAPYYALCDQDDIWEPYKLKHAITALQDQIGASLFYHAMDIVDENLQKYDYYYRNPAISKSLVNSVLYGDEIAGCSMVFNYELMKAIRKYKPTFITMHDGWIHRVCLCVGGTIVSSKIPEIKYRQHSTNAVGMKKKQLVQYFRAVKEHNSYFSKLAMQMMIGYQSEMTSKELNFLKCAANYKNITNRVKLLKQAIVSDVGFENKVSVILKILLGIF